MAYQRRQVTDHVTKMNKDLYDNVQDGIDECKQDLGVVNTLLGSINEYNSNTTYSKGSYVIHGGTMYESVVSIELPEEWTVEHWKPATVLSLLQSVSADVPFKFGVDENGNYGFIKDGADTVTPFKKGGIHIGFLDFAYVDERTFKGHYISFEVKDLSLLKIDGVYIVKGSTTAYLKFVVLGGNTIPSISDTNYSWGDTLLLENIKEASTNVTLSDLEVDISDYDYIIIWLDATSLKDPNYMRAGARLLGIDIS